MADPPDSLSPVLFAAQVEIPSFHNLEALQNVFSTAQALPLLQRFPGGNPTAAAIGLVRSGWSNTSIHLLAEMKDEHIFTGATKMNEPIYRLGDCFEIFLQAEGEEPYLEFHVAPNNVVLQLLYPSSREFTAYRMREPEFLERFTLKEPAFTSRVWTTPEENRWTVFASIDLRLLLPRLPTLAQTRWSFHFSRYDYPADGGKPILSCTSVLRRLDFHAIEDWGKLHFRD